MKKNILLLWIIILCVWVSWWTTLFLMSKYYSVTVKHNSLVEISPTILASTVSITGTLDDKGITTTRSGTGIIVRDDGLILTNKHLISEWFTYSIQLHDATTFSAKVLKVHPALDLALLVIISDQPLRLSVGDFINSQSHVSPWQGVIAIGNTLGIYPWSISEGIVAGLNRSVSFNGNIMDWLIQTSIPMTLGNSGGPLINPEGKIIGINIGIVGWSSQIGWTLPLTQEMIETFLKS